MGAASDLRWGVAEKKGFRRLIHPNAVNLLGRWKIDDKDTGYTGYFQRGSEGLLVARYSTCCSETRRGHTRSLALVGKLYPTLEVNHREPLRTAGFITQEDLGGANTYYFNDAELRNAPDTTPWRRGFGLPFFLLTGLVLIRADKKPSVRQLYEIAELGKSPDEPTKAPEFMRLLVDSSQPRMEGEGLDFRDELLGQIYDKGDPAPKRQIVFNIEVSDEGETTGLLAQRVIISRSLKTIRDRS